MEGAPKRTATRYGLLLLLCFPQNPYSRPITGIRNFVVGFIIQASSTPENLHQQRLLINKLNLVLVSILKQDWPHDWPDFINEIISSCRTNLSICENNMAILRLLSEEVFDFSAEQMTQAKTKNLKTTMCQEFSSIFQLCSEVLSQAEQPSLAKATLETLLRFLNWIPLGYIFETPIIETLRTRFLEQPEFRNVTMKCLTEIGGLQVKTPAYDDKLVEMFTTVMTSVSNIIPLSTDLKSIYHNSNGRDQEFIQNLALFLCNFFTPHVRVKSILFFSSLFCYFSPFFCLTTDTRVSHSSSKNCPTKNTSPMPISTLFGYPRLRTARYSKSAWNIGISWSRNCLKRCNRCP